MYKMVWKYIQIIDHIKPKAFVFENVTGLLSAKNSKKEKIIDLLKAAFEQIGYSITLQVLNAADYGVPQQRKNVNKENGLPLKGFPAVPRRCAPRNDAELC